MNLKGPAAGACAFSRWAHPHKVIKNLNTLPFPCSSPEQFHSDLFFFFLFFFFSIFLIFLLSEPIDVLIHLGDKTSVDR